MIERNEPEKATGYPKQTPPPQGKHYACSLCHEKYEVTDEQARTLKCCGLPVQRTEEIIMSTPEPFGP